jgi:hypothetical protein
MLLPVLGTDLSCWGHVVVQWLRHCATNQKVAGLIPDGVIGIFHIAVPFLPELLESSLLSTQLNYQMDCVKPDDVLDGLCKMCEERKTKPKCFMIY